MRNYLIRSGYLERKLQETSLFTKIDFLFGDLSKRESLKMCIHQSYDFKLINFINCSFQKIPYSPNECRFPLWYEFFLKTITTYAFIRLENDCGSYIKNVTYLLLYVDDLLILEIVDSKKYLSALLKMKDLGNNNLTYLGIVIEKNSKGIFIDQSKYLKKIFEKIQHGKLL